MRLLQAATSACEAMDDPRAALRFLRESHTLHETLAGRTARARFIALQAAHEVETARQERDRAAFAERGGYEGAGVFKETGSGARLDRAERRKVMALAQARRIDAVLVTELSR